MVSPFIKRRIEATESFGEVIKALRIEKGFTYQEIADKTEENGEAVSLSTIKLVFSDKYNHDHDYRTTLQPIANVLMPPSENDNIEVKTLQTRLELKDEIINQLQSRLDAKEQKHKDREEFYMQQIEFLQGQIKFKDEQIKHHNEVIDRKDNTIRELYSILIGTKSVKEVFV